VSAVDSTGFEGAKSFAVRVQTPAGNTAPLAPVNLTAQPGNAQVTLKWNRNTEADFLKYRIYRGTNSSSETLVDSS
jgi:glucosylceramidase